MSVTYEVDTDIVRTMAGTISVVTRVVKVTETETREETGAVITTCRTEAAGTFVNHLEAEHE